MVLSRKFSSGETRIRNKKYANEETLSVKLNLVFENITSNVDRATVCL